MANKKGSRRLTIPATLSAASLAVMVTASCGASSDADLTTITASHQPALHTLPTVIAQEEGWFEELGLSVEVQLYDSGAPQIEAGASGAWQVGAMGTVPTLVGATEYDMHMIGQSNDESATNAVYVRPENANEDPAELLEGSTILASTISTGQYALDGCLEKYDVDTSQNEIVNLEQSAVLSSSVSGEGDVFQYWAPFTYQAEEQADQVMICNGEEADREIPGGLVATDAAVNDRPEDVAAWLTGYLMGIQFIEDEPEAALEYLRDFYLEQGIDISDESLAKEFELRPMLDLDGQLEWMESEAPEVMNEIAVYLEEKDAIGEVPDTENLLNTEILDIVQEDFAETLE